MTATYVSLGIFAAILAGLFLIVLARSWLWARDDDPPLRGLALPEGSIRALLAFLVIGAFVTFVFFGRNAVDFGVEAQETPAPTATADAEEPEATPTAAGTDGVAEADDSEDTEAAGTPFNTVLIALGTLSAVVTGFYFGTRGRSEEEPVGGP